MADPEMLDVLLLPVALVALGGLALWSAWLALGEYRQLFIRNPRLLMSVEVFTTLAEIGGPGYLAAILAIAGLWMLVVGIYLAAAMFGAFLNELRV